MPYELIYLGTGVPISYKFYKYAKFAADMNRYPAATFPQGSFNRHGEIEFLGENVYGIHWFVVLKEFVRYFVTSGQLYLAKMVKANGKTQVKLELALRTCLMLFLFFLSNHAHAQSQEDHNKITPKQGQGYFEVITSIVNANSFEGDEGNIGNEFHFTYWFNHTLGTGLSLTTKVKEDGLIYDTAIIGSWSPMNWITTNVGPNFSWANEHRDFGISAYVEVELNFFVIEEIHIGPVFGILAGSENEYTHGFHLGFEF